MNWNSFVDNITAMVVLFSIFFGLIGYALGLEQGSPVFDVTEIVWTASREPLTMEAFSLECRLIPK